MAKNKISDKRVAALNTWIYGENFSFCQIETNEQKWKRSETQPDNDVLSLTHPEN